MINIRRNCFETNSSSMHSLVVSRIIKPYSKEELALGYSDWRKERNQDFDLWEWIEANDMIFERSPFQVLRTPVEKLRYYTAYTLGNYKKPKKSDIKKIEDFVMKQTGITNRKKIKLYKEDTEWYKPKKLRKNITYGAVYSNDTGEDPMHYVERKGITMEDLILNPKYTIVVDGDEIQYFKALFEAGIIDADNLEDISSGADFWNDSETSIYLNWLDEDDIESLDDFVSERVFNYTKTLVFRSQFVLDESTNKYSQKEYSLDSVQLNEVIKQIIAKATQINPHIDVVFCAYTDDDEKLTMNDLKDLDLSMYKLIQIENHDDERW